MEVATVKIMGVEVGINREEGGSSGVTVPHTGRGDGREHQEETAMWPTWKTLPARWNQVMRVVLVAVVLFVSACAAPGRSTSTPGGFGSEAEYAGPKDSGNGGGY
jgi:hypothetical protein